ncbi:ABC transporter ATP-binding protein [Carnobacterium divergens]|uniref:ABC transporter ATP-binding protein n=1 Tax=Carnobacterium divergens TaxID=2748 RepID=UPI001071986B|nr:ABC transporter ATP-binding protein [Carnobacterium divergens]MDT1995841.1 ABC transporter ATP-binding protein [Carnobacterium divergens]TFI68464.1 ABC transporter ATP-binding protein [Carnobacterium divergens]TFI68661.1 ABC transporter ATP-binding protein [Carnobacterium divergens]TFI72570.1 ABC transporter ATP-binding protein [Carnobacterium divergens]TFI83654.1 ABC transporter ATP-binding protein [Carnobacterium divergens]
MNLLEVNKLTKNFGGLAAVSMVNLELGNNELVGLIGPNGAGKTTLFNLLTGVYAPSEGTIDLTVDNKTQRLNGKKPYKITDLGLARTFQNIRLFKELTVLDNVLIAMHGKDKVGTLRSILRTPAFYQSEEKMKQEAIALLKLFKLETKEKELAKNLPYGEQRRLEIVRALATKPKILFLDEPAAGMNPQETAELTALIRQIQQQFQMTILLIEHDMSLVMKVCERIYVLEYGRMIAHGTPNEIKNNEAVIKAYLGGD